MVLGYLVVVLGRVGPCCWVGLRDKTLLADVVGWYGSGSLLFSLIIVL